MPRETARLPIAIRLEQIDYAGGAVLSFATLLLSFVMLLGINRLQRRLARSF